MLSYERAGGTRRNHFYAGGWGGTGRTSMTAIKALHPAFR